MMGITTILVVFLLHIVCCVQTKQHHFVGKSIISYTRNLLLRPVKTLGAMSAIFLSTKVAKSDALISGNGDVLILSHRIINKDYSIFRPGKINSDIFYPSWFAGRWNTTSTMVALEAPLGIQAFGGERAYKSALADLDSSLNYTTRFRTLSNGFVLNDRLYNVEQIAKASIGSRCIVDDTQEVSYPFIEMKNKSLVVILYTSKTGLDPATFLHLIISPPNSDGLLYSVDLYCTDRLQEQEDVKCFNTLERTLQTVSIRRSDPPPPPPFRKEIETLTHYTLVRLCNSTYSSTSSPSVVAAVQRTATYLSPLDARYVSLMANATAVDTLPVDVRTYQLVFSQLP